MSVNKCKYLGWYRINDTWVSECNNKDCIYYGDECVEKIGAESERCTAKEKE